MTLDETVEPTAFGTARNLGSDGSGGLVSELLPSWDNGMGVFGGYLCALVLGAAAVEAAGEGRPHSLSVEFLEVGRPGPVQASVEVLRRSSRARCDQVLLVQGDKVLTRGTVWSGPSRPDGALRHATPFEEPLPAPDVVPVLGSWDTAPSFRQRFEVRPLPGYDGREEDQLRAWYRFLPADDWTDPWVHAMRCAALGDLGPQVSAMRRHEGEDVSFRMVTLSLSLTFTWPASSHDEFLYVHGDSPVAGGGAGIGTCRIYTASRELVAATLSHHLVNEFKL